MGNKEKDLKDGLDLTENSIFKFRCGNDMACFTKCCRDVNIFLTPYDLLRMRKHLGMTSDEFIEKHTRIIFSDISGLPIVFLKMSEDETKVCSFMSKAGCEIYEDRPWACRMYPLNKKEQPGHFDLIVNQDFCEGLRQENKINISEYLTSQGIEIFEEMEKPFIDITNNPRLLKEGIILNDKIKQMFFMAYDLDKFKKFIFESRFLSIFDVPQKQIALMHEDETELLKFCFTWLKFGMIQGDSLKLSREELMNKMTQEKLSKNEKTKKD